MYPPSTMQNFFSSSLKAGFFALIILSACSHKESSFDRTKVDNSDSEPVFIENIVFARADTAILKLNIAISAAQKQKNPLLIFIHGGGWQTGHRNAYNTQIQEAATRGFTAATISHRYTRTVNEQGEPLYRWPDPLHDVKAAVRFLRAHADSFRIHPDKIGALGASSGAHLAMMLGFTDPESGLEGNLDVPKTRNPTVSTRIHAVANLSGPADLAAGYDAPVITPYLEALMNGGPQQYPEKYNQASPGPKKRSC